MCDDLTQADLDVLSRRQLGVIAGGLALAAATPAFATGAQPVTGRDVSVKTPDGQVDAYFVAPAKGKHPGVIIWPDIFGLRPAMQQMGKRLAENGYAVLVVNPFYRSGKAPVTPPGAPFDAAFRAKIGPMRALLTPDAVARDATAFAAFLDAQASVDKKRKIGAAGYCMGGALVLRTAAAVPSRVGAGASFHGGTLAGAEPDSPHLLIPKMRARFLIAHAQNDDARDPADKDRLRAAFAAAKRPAEIEVYPAMHGWCPPDGSAYDAVQAERAWARMLALFKGALV